MLRPFDRDRDLAKPRKAVDPNSSGGSLGMRFSGGNGSSQRSFL